MTDTALLLMEAGIQPCSDRSHSKSHEKTIPIFLYNVPTWSELDENKISKLSNP